MRNPTRAQLASMSDDEISDVAVLEAVEMAKQSAETAWIVARGVAAKNGIDLASLTFALMERLAGRTRRGRLVAQVAPVYYATLYTPIDFKPDSGELFRAGSLDGAVVSLSALGALVVELSNGTADVNTAAFAAYRYFMKWSFDVHPDLEQLLGPHD